MGMNTVSANDKALRINIDAARYGTFAEIGAGQEVARWFFHVGGAAGTVAKTMSAYDMAVSDAIYGPGERYVSRQRLAAMLDHEWTLLLERLDFEAGGEDALLRLCRHRCNKEPYEAGGRSWLARHPVPERATRAGL